MLFQFPSCPKRLFDLLILMAGSLTRGSAGRGDGVDPELFSQQVA